MATNVLWLWTGSADGDLNNASNWTDIGTGSPSGSVPVTGEGVVVDERSVRAPDTDFSSAVALNRFEYRPGAKVGWDTGNVGFTNLSVDNGSDAIARIAGSGDKIYLNGDTTRVDIYPSSSTQVYFAAGAHAEINAQSGRVFVLGPADVDFIRASGAQMHVAKNTGSANQLDTLIVASGLIECKRDLIDATVGGGALRTLGEAAISDGNTFVSSMGSNAAELKVYGGRVEYLSSGDVNILDLEIGEFDPRGNPHGDVTIHQKTVNMATAKLHENWSGFSVADGGGDVEEIGDPGFTSRA